jgi:phenylalanyl-tRNA synthetase alpha chain
MSIELLKKEFEACTNTTKLIEIKNTFIKKYLNPIYSELKTAQGEEKNKIGKQANELKTQINDLFNEYIAKSSNQEETNNHVVNIDVTINSTNLQKGSLHPVTLVINEIADYFKKLNFVIQSGDEIVDVKYNFDNLGVEPGHPTRETSETFYIDPKTILRTQNTANSAIYMENNKSSDIRIMNYG